MGTDVTTIEQLDQLLKTKYGPEARAMLIADGYYRPTIRVAIPGQDNQSFDCSIHRRRKSIEEEIADEIARRRSQT